MVAREGIHGGLFFARETFGLCITTKSHWIDPY